MLAGAGLTTDVVAVTIEIKRADGSVTHEVLPDVFAAVEYLANQS